MPSHFCKAKDQHRSLLPCHSFSYTSFVSFIPSFLVACFITLTDGLQHAMAVWATAAFPCYRENPPWPKCLANIKDNLVVSRPDQEVMHYRPLKTPQFLLVPYSQGFDVHAQQMMERDTTGGGDWEVESQNFCWMASCRIWS